ncbi:MAG: hypothetical protein GYB49_01920 [Alphaproteobacteria bacterium]|mgnify:CR=1 FL=1|nr:hypothetical protein [Alphaproteobacteria bacterium]
MNCLQEHLSGTIGHSVPEGAGRLVMSALERELTAGRADGLSPRTLPVVDTWFEAALDLSAAEGFGKTATALRNVKDRLYWDSIYPIEDVGEDFDAYCAFAELVGPNAPVRAEGYSAGLTLIAPDFLYNWHTHPASEIYMILTPQSLWALNDGPFMAKSAGDVVYHASGAPHAMKTQGHVLLAPWIWTGDIATEPQMRSGSR